MDITETYYLAHIARKKLTVQAARADYDLRLLVGHANLLDNLMLDLSEAEREYEIRSKQSEKPSTRNIEFAEPTSRDDVEDDWSLEDVAVGSDVSDDDYDEDDDDSSDSYDEAEFLVNSHPITIPAPRAEITITEKEINEDDDDKEEGIEEEYEEDIGPVFVDDDEEEDDEEEYQELSLTRSPSRHCHPPELASDSGEDSEEDSLPPSPTQIVFESFDMKPASVESTPAQVAVPIPCKPRLEPHSDLSTMVHPC